MLFLNNASQNFSRKTLNFTRIFPEFWVWIWLTGDSAFKDFDPPHPHQCLGKWTLAILYFCTYFLKIQVCLHTKLAPYCSKMFSTPDKSLPKDSHLDSLANLGPK